jgi:YidC/Oxa1 family membrane protein insertase
MDYRKIFLYVAIIAVGLILINQWQKDYPPVPMTQAPAASSSSVPTAPSVGNTSMPAAPARAVMSSGKLVTVDTDVFTVTIDTHGGSIVGTTLNTYKDEQNQSQPVQLLSADPSHYYVAESGVTGSEGPDTAAGQVVYQTASTHYVLGNQSQLAVDLTYTGKGISVTKEYIFTKGSYAIQMNYRIRNNKGSPWTGFVYTQLSRTEPPTHSSLLTHYATFVGGAISSPADHYQKIKFSDFSDGAAAQTTQGGWAAMMQQYFLSAWVPNKNDTYQYYSKVNEAGVYTLGMISATITIPAGQTVTSTHQLYMGPAIKENLDKVSPYLSMTIDYGWLWFISQLIFWMLSHVYALLGNWGWSIIVVTLIIKAFFYPLSNKSFHSMARLRLLQPRINQLKERHGDDKQAMGKAMMDLYRTEKVNPLGGCLPMLVQIPVFIALYWVIIQSVELRQAPWILWVNDLSQHDPFYILPIIMGGLMFLQQKLSPPPPDPTQAKVMLFMPVIFTVLFLGFPSGLVLYWVTNTLVTVIHQYYILVQYERVEKQKKVVPAHKKKN